MSDFNFPFPLDWYFFLGLSLGALIVALTSFQKFREPTNEPNGKELLQQLSPRYLTTHEEYSRAFLLYYLAPMLFVLLVGALLGPGVLKLGDVNLPQTGWPAGVWPIAFAILVSGLTTVPWLKELEVMARRFAHERAYIPERARATAERLRAADYNFGSCAGALTTSALRGVNASDFESSRDSLEYAWARLCCVSHEIDRRRDGTGADDLDGEMLDRYAKELDAIAESRRSMEAEMAQYRQDQGADPARTQRLTQGAKHLLRQLYVFLACAVLQKHGNRADMMSAFRPFGFSLSPMPIAGRNTDLIVVGLFAMTVSVFVLIFAALEIGRLFGNGELWQRTDDFPSKSYDPFVWAVSAAFIHGTAILVADRLRARLVGRGRWFALIDQERQAIPANYIRIAVACGLAGYVVMCLWGAMLQGPTLAMLSGAAPYALLPAATGGFYAYHLDNVALNTRPPRGLEIAYQALATGFCSLVAAPVWLALGRGTNDALDFIVLSAAIGACVGAALAWYIPKAAVRRQATPLNIVRRDRVATLAAAAHERFKDQDLAEQWLRQPSQALGNVSPIAAAADIDQYDNVIGLLRRPGTAA